MRTQAKRNLVFSVGVLAALGVAGMSEESCAQAISYREDVAPLLLIRCQECHQQGAEGFEKSGLDLTSYAGLMKGTRHGPVVVPGDPFTSNFIVLIEGRAASVLRMPHDRKPLSKCEVDTFRAWIRQGARDN